METRKFNWRRHSAPVVIASMILAALSVVLYFNIREYLAVRDEVRFDANLPRVTVDLGYARYAGNSLPSGVNQFLGMRYAASPIGNLRWRAPQDPEPKEGTTDAIDFGPICLGTDVTYPTSGQDEDCLYANVWSPTNATADSKLPVWLFIQGGGYTSNANPNWNGSQVVDVSGKNIVFVNFNYRVGLWGFLASERVRKDGELNVGLLDQRLMMKWVQTHISKFGGDPNHVVIHGLSAGAGSVALQLAAYGGRDEKLFAGAMSESVFFPAQPRVPELEYQFNQTLDKLGCTDDKDQMGCLRGKDIKAIQDANIASPFPGRLANPHFYWTPCIDGDILQDYPYRLFEKGSFIKVPVLFGTGSNEGSVFAANVATQDQFVSFMTDNYPKLTKNETDPMLQKYPLLPQLPNHNIWFPSTSQAYGETTFICPANTIMNAYAAANRSGTSWSYRFNVQDNDNTASGLGVPHVFEAPAVFGIDACPTPDSFRTYNRPIVSLMMKYVISFVRDLNPNTFKLAGAPDWGDWGRNQSRYVFELNNNRMENVDDGQRDRCNFWEGIVEVMEQ
ncbi:Alpha/Beta hydrolase protein [Colletotrichum phormii]|uniref:Carboxylic ester hydrolase n=1 Tax=Colletotrichum phormii TaxID=359342 RepID=A0AAI9ZS01_9PEZI|nr:Alpha/Beta hydrolase protein [Colletotrichum phormii]KAK1636801.1 Alpha/Beta hydrolase protein [Colletotrichum phormii]